MRTVREVLNTIKEIKGISTDAELAKLIGIPVHTMRSWIQNDSIRKQLLFYCFKNNISIDEVFFGELIFNRERCEKCKKKSICSVYREIQLTPATIEEIEGALHIKISAIEKDQFICKLFDDDMLLSNYSVNIENVDKIIILLKKNNKGGY